MNNEESREYPVSNDGMSWEYLKWALEGGKNLKIDTYTGPVSLKEKELGILEVSSGWIVAIDPGIIEPGFSEEFEIPFAHQIPPGRYPICVNIATRLEDGDQRVAFGILKLAKEPPVRWEVATLKDQELVAGEHPEAHGYGVDSGTGCFIDLNIIPLIKEGELSIWELLEEKLEETYVDTWSWANLRAEKGSSSNLIAFSSGDGDGRYPSFWGFGQSGNRVVLVTDFYITMPPHESD